jgi:hypothetical protein
MKKFIYILLFTLATGCIVMSCDGNSLSSQLDEKDCGGAQTSLENP